MACFRRLLCALLFVVLALAQNTLPALRVAGNMTTIELAPSWLLRPASIPDP
jgi:hypothetical protein